MQFNIHSLQIIQTFEQLKHETDILSSIVKSGKQSRCANWEGLHRSPNLYLGESISALSYSDLFSTAEMDGRQLIQRPGLVILPDSLIDHVNKVNALKLKFTNVISEYKSSLNNSTSIFDSVRHILSSAGYPRVHINQTKRKLVCYEDFPVSMVWYVEKGSWGKQQTFSKKAALELLDRAIKNGKDNDRLIISRYKLATFPENEVLVRRHKSTDSIRVKITNRYSHSVNYIGSMPIFIPESKVDIDHLDLKFNLDLNRNHIKKNRTKFIEEPFISSLSLYRYKEQFRIESWKRFQLTNNMSS